MKMLLLLVIAFASLGALAQSISPQDIEPMLKQMEASGQIDAKQAEITRKYMKTMDDQKWAEIQKKAEDCIKRNPAAAEKAAAGEPVPLDACN